MLWTVCDGSHARWLSYGILRTTDLVVGLWDERVVSTRRPSVGGQARHVFLDIAVLSFLGAMYLLWMIGLGAAAAVDM